MATITVLKDNIPTGPFTREQVAQKLQIGEMHLEDLAFIEGLSQWTPLREVLVKVDGAAFSPPSPSPVAAPGIQAYSHATTLQSPGQVQYAGFWLRVVAYIVDYIILNIPLMILSAIAGAVFEAMIIAIHPDDRGGFTNLRGEPNVPFILFELCVIAFSVTATWLYFALQESSSAQATIGKRVLGLRVTDLQGNRIGFGQATGRFFGKILSGLTLLIGYMMAGFTDRKQALHDMIAGTLVVRK